MERLADNSRKLGFLLDLMMIIVSFFIAYYVFEDVRGFPAFLPSDPIYYKTLVLSMIAWMSCLALFSEYPVRRLVGVVQELWIVLRVNSLAVLFFSLLAFTLKYGGFSRLFIGLYFVSSCVLMVLSRFGVHAYLFFIRRAGWDARTRIIIGSGEAALRYVNSVESNKRFGLRVVGIVADTADPELLPAPHLGPLKSLESILSGHSADGVVIALAASNPYLERVIQVCESHGLTTELVLDGLASKIASSEVVHGMGISRLVLSGIPHSPNGLVLKRITDAVVSGLALLLLSPVFAIVAVLIKLDDRGPVFFGQERVGLHKRTFRMYKFRSMVIDAETRKSELQHLNEMSGPVFKISDDPRITTVGKILRKTSLDELPQLFNVFVGNMSLVGPRPPLPSEVAQYEHVYHRRLSVKPGITCLWQISGRNNVDFEQWMELDLRYIDNWSYVGDLKILVKTLPAVFKRQGAC